MVQDHTKRGRASARRAAPHKRNNHRKSYTAHRQVLPIYRSPAVPPYRIGRAKSLKR